MRTLLRITIALPLLAAVALAQDEGLKADKVKLDAELAQINQLRQLKLQAVGAVSGLTVKGAPYSGEEVNETSQVLADGTRIHKETHATVYRDSEGRTRRETPESIIISDPVAGATYILNPKSMTGQKLAMAAGTYSYVRTASSSSSSSDGPATTFTMRMESDGGTPTITVNGKTLDPKAVAELIAKAKANGDSTVNFEGMPVDPAMLDKAKAGMAAGMMMGPVHTDGHVAIVGPLAAPTKRLAGESLGKQTFEGVEAEGTRNVNTIETGAIGNDRPIQVTSERWYSPDLQTVVMTKHSDPRTGDESFRLVNIRRGDPGSYLFQPPAGYNITERK